MLENTRPCSSASGRYSEPRCRRQIGLSTFYTWTYSMCLSVPVTCGNEQILTDIYNVKICVIIAFYWQKPMDRRLGKSEKQCRIYDSDLKCALQPDLWVHQVRCATQVNFSVPLVKWTGVCLCLCQRVVNVPVYCLPVRLCETWVLFVRNTHLLPLYLYCIYYCLWIVEVHLWGQSNALSLLIDDPQSIKIYTLELFKHKCGLFFPLQSKTHCSKEMKGPENSISWYLQPWMLHPGRAGWLRRYYRLLPEETRSLRKSETTEKWVRRDKQGSVATPAPE